MNSLKIAMQSGEPLLIEPNKAAMIAERSADLLASIKQDQAGAEMLTALLGNQPKAEKVGKAGIIPIKGAIGSNLMPIEKILGMVDVNDIRKNIDAFEKDPQITHLVFDINSPGGTVTGVPELASRIRNSTKPTIAFTDSQAASAGYWLGSQSQRFLATGSASVGSVGVYRVVPDATKAFENMGVKMEVFKSGKYKAIGLPGTAIDADGKEMIQQSVVDVHNDFKADVRSVRSLVPDSAMEGQSFPAKKAASIGMLTGIVSGMDQVLAEINR
ncbi:SppA Periplasmic serine proteases (ClpP class) [uncultured Caudovirales phage]|uniref:SppA Periplasmic serine proteases (ClpP class) n=1 Tax=uncultured Caudovirales phage TaxID=2100421 RepID=A0A6J5MQC0_9CAUD|nr:SppA Periplasmic serine proteases (ClpP class) [uncultured Caudovirales phage]